MVNKYDVRVALFYLYFTVMVIPYFVIAGIGVSFSWLHERINHANTVFDEWANPDKYGNAPKRCRKLIYSRKTVEDLSARVESLNRIIQKQGGGETIT